MKKLINLLFLLSLVFIMFACQSKNSTVKDNNETGVVEDTNKQGEVEEVKEGSACQLINQF